MKASQIIASFVDPAQPEWITRRSLGIIALARAIGKPYSTVKSWRDAECIPHKHWRAIIEAGKVHTPRVHLTPYDFVPDDLP
jgi:hypothetical protein